MLKPNFFLRAVFWLAISAGCGGVLIICGSALYLSPKLPSVELIRDIRLQIPLRIYSADGYLIGEFGEQKRTPISYQQIPSSFTQAILAAEDARFFSHPGVDLKGLIRAATELASTGSIQSGGSTITMQVAKNYFLTHERTFLRKFNEILLAIQIERELSKEEILELYVNKIYLGHRAYGIEAAANVYYGRTINALTLAELAMLAGLPKAPSANNPITNPDRAITRRDWILQRMLELGYISQTEYDDARQQPNTARLHTTQPEVSADYLAEMVRQEMINRFGLDAYTEGYRVYTTVTREQQHAANLAVQKGLLDYDQRHGYRGPLAQLALPTGDEQTGHATELNVSRLLADYRGYGPLRVGLVVKCDEQQAAVTLSDQTTIALPFDNAKWARSYINVNQRGPQPKHLLEVMAVGQVIYVYQADDGNWHLGQLPDLQSALIALNPTDGAVRALVGGFDFQASKFNRVTQAGRQAGSSFKPFIYASALARGMTAASLINDAPVVFEDAGLENTWRPVNEGGVFGGPTRLREALYRSRNLVSIRVLRSIGIRNAIEDAARFGFRVDQLPANLSLALGSAALTPMEVAIGYAAFANGGFLIEPWIIERVVDETDNVIFQHNPLRACKECETEQANTQSDNSEFAELQEILAQARDATKASSVATDEPDSASAVELAQAPRLAPRVMDERDHYILNSMMQDVIKRGTGTPARALQRNDLAGKTGTTNDQRDVWFAGYNQDMVAAVWAGFDAPEPLGRREFGSTVALPIWIDFMRVALRESEDRPFPQPSGIVTARIDAETGKLATPGTTQVIFELFRAENVPQAETQNGVPNPYQEDSLPEQLF